ncbi:type 4b pilus protein PilO2 [Dyella ginsengisoli]|uniref:type 4b pilus protein PilO2 n=1 Tax=Dyella ginsengisoli TaxID=363848 RepID=UPI0003499A65|nr:type 4b pilus protein PilO2 [Dyella ginsengisoli]
MAIESFARKGRTFAAGLTWTTVDTPKQWRVECESKAPEGHDLVNMWRAAPGQYQFGFATSGDGVYAGAYALATALCLSLGKDWAGMFELPAVAADGSPAYAFVAIAETGAVLADEVGSRADAAGHLQLFLKELKLYQATVGRVFAPADLGVQDATSPEPVEDLVDRVGRVANGFVGKLPALANFAPIQRQALQAARLQSTRRGKLTGVTQKRVEKGAGRSMGDVAKLVAALVLVGGMSGQMWWSHHKQVLIDAEAAEKIRQMHERQKQQHDAAELAKANARAATRAAEASAANSALPPPWTSLPSVKDFVDACSRAIAPVPLALGNWTFKDFTCVNGNFTVNYDRTPTGTDQEFIAAVQKTFGVQPTIGANHAIGTVTMLFKPAPATAEDISTAGNVVSEVLSHFQALKDPIVLTPVPAPTGPDPNHPLPPPAWQTFSFTMHTQITADNSEHYPSLLLSGLDVPGLRVTSVTAKHETSPPYMTWVIEGNLYVEAKANAL